MIQLKNINIQINTMAMLSKINGNMSLNIAEESENAIVIYDKNLRKDVFYSDLTEENIIIWNNYIDMCLNKVNITKDNLGQIINQYDAERIIINTIDILVDSSKQFIVYFNELTSSELLILNNFDSLIKVKLI